VNRQTLLDHAARRANAYLDQVADRPVRAEADGVELRAMLGGPLGRAGEPPHAVIDRLADAGLRGTEVARGRLRVIAYEELLVETPKPAVVQRVCAVNKPADA
jgi:hypothetical protein